MPDERWWVALVTFERGEEAQEILPERAHGACGWMGARAPDLGTARNLIVQDLEHVGLRVLEIDQEQEVFSKDEIADLDDHLADNFGSIEPGKRTVWGTIHLYLAEGEA